MYKAAAAERETGLRLVFNAFRKDGARKTSSLAPRVQCTLQRDTKPKTFGFYADPNQPLAL